jgi:hypothetical protein
VNDVQSRKLSPETHIRVIIYDSKTGREQVSSKHLMLPVMTPEEQQRRLCLIPLDYEPGASQELVNLIEQSRTNTNIPEL